MGSASAPSVNIIVLMGVSGSGKTTVGKALADALRCPFYDGDDFQPRDNLNKMAQGIPLNDRDRRPWLLALHSLLAGIRAKKGKAVMACSALKQDYRDLLIKGLEGIRFVYLKAGYALLEERLKQRPGHFFKAGLLGSQFEILEEPEDALVADAESPIETLIATILAGLEP